MKVVLVRKTPLQKAMKKAEPNSLRHAVVTRRWQSLWINPLAWHYGHLEVLQCPAPCLVTPAAISSPISSSTRSEYPFHTDLRNFHETLAHVVLLKNRALLLREIIKCIVRHKRSEYDIAGLKVKREGRLVLHYGTKRVANSTIHMIGREDGNFPVFVYVDHVWLDGVYRLSNSFANEQRHIYRVYPEPEIDPFFVATMIAMAQTQYYSTVRGENGATDEETFQVHLLCPNKEISSLSRYSANISKKYLMKFENPYKSFNTRLEITRLETPVDSLDELGELVEDILLHNVPIQCHPPATHVRLQTLSATPGPETPDTRDSMFPEQGQKQEDLRINLDEDT